MSKNFKHKLSLNKSTRTQKKIINDSDEDSINEESDEESINEESDEDSVNEELENDFNNKKFKEDDIRNIIFEKINDKFAYGKLDKFKVVIMINNGYINATKLCNDANKQLIHWMENKRSKEMIKDFGKFTGLSRDELVIKVNGGKLTKISGTYMHYTLITHIASWCNTKYAFIVSTIVNNYHSKQAVEEKDKMLQKKDDKIDKMSKKIDTLVENNNTLVENNNTILKKNKKMNSRIKRLVRQNDEIYDQNLETHGKLDAISNERLNSDNA
jgi:hypothetical protein